jgi:pilus assembly protein CpaF
MTAPTSSAGAPPDPGLVESLRARAARRWARDGARPEPGEIARAAEAALDEDRAILPGAQRALIVQAVVDAALGLGPLEPLFRDPEVTEVMVCGHDRAYVERGGRIEPAGALFADDGHLLHVIDRILAPLGRRVDEATPMADARLPDGSRVNVVIPPLAVDGPALTIRRFGRVRLGADDLLALGALDRAVLDRLHEAVRARRNILVSGGTGSGKTTLMAALCEAIPAEERVVTIEDAAELALPLPHVVRLEARPASLEGAGEVPIRALVRNALRMRPDRIIVGEVRGGEAIDMLSAMTTGHEGSLSTLHASSPGDALRRLRLMALMGGLELPYRAVAEHVASAVDVVVHCERLPGGARRVVEVLEVDAAADVAADDGAPESPLR